MRSLEYKTRLDLHYLACNYTRMLNSSEILKQTQAFVTNALQNADAAHDIQHIQRVVRLSEKLAHSVLGADELEWQLIAWLHDVDDTKVTGVETEEPVKARAFLQEQTVPDELIQRVLTGIKQISFSKQVNQGTLRLEAKLVQDADRLDALGALGIARCFAYAGSVGSPLYKADSESGMSSEATNGNAVGHFYKKLFKLPETMHTDLAKTMAEKRIQFMHCFLTRMELEVADLI